MTLSELWVRRGCAVVVAAVAAYASYEHQRAFAAHGGADAAGASLWPLSVDGLLMLATIGLLKPGDQSGRRARYAVRLAFLLGIGVSLAANVAAAPRMAWQPVLVAGWPPVALLLSVELLAHSPGDRGSAESAPRETPRDRSQPEIDMKMDERDKPGTEKRDEGTGSGGGAADRGQSEDSPPRRAPNAEQVMWDHFQRQQEQGRTPTGAELDRVASTNNYGRAVLARWRRTGRIPEAQGRPPVNDTSG